MLWAKTNTCSASFLLLSSEFQLYSYARPPRPENSRFFLSTNSALLGFDSWMVNVLISFVIQERPSSPLLAEV